MSRFIRFAFVGLALALSGCDQQEIAFTSQVSLVTTEQPGVYDVNLVLEETQGKQV